MTRNHLAGSAVLAGALLTSGLLLGFAEPLALRLLLLLAAGSGGTALMLLLARRAAAPAHARLAENVASLERTHRELVAARAETVRAARLASVGTLAAGVAHEVGNPLGALMAWVDLARGRTREGRLDEEILDAMREEVDRIDRIVRGLLDYARPGEGGAAPRPPLEVVERVRQLMESQGRLLGVEVRVEPAADTPDVVADAHRLEHVLVNLVLNALDAMDGRYPKRLTFRTYADLGDALVLPSRREGDPPGVNYMHRRRISRDDGGIGVDPVFVSERVAVIEVWDSGPGIAPEDLPRVFDPFFTTKEPGRGTGLGLAICARLVEGMGGRVEATNAPNGGARFIIRLPAARPPDHGEAP